MCWKLGNVYVFRFIWMDKGRLLQHTLPQQSGYREACMQNVQPCANIFVCTNVNCKIDILQVQIKCIKNISSGLKKQKKTGTHKLPVDFKVERFSDSCLQWVVQKTSASQCVTSRDATDLNVILNPTVCHQFNLCSNFIFIVKTSSE